jgi:hypothetical protein
MELYIERDTFTPLSTIGRLYIAGVFECFTLEPASRPPGIKVEGKTAIPEGRYQLTIDYSPKFARQMPLVNDVPNFEAIRIHVGNTAADTEGCTLLGLTHGADQIVSSRAAFDAFFPKLVGFIAAGEEVFLTYSDSRNQPGGQMGFGLEAEA